MHNVGIGLMGKKSYCVLTGTCMYYTHSEERVSGMMLLAGSRQKRNKEVEEE